jgi:hypothetical protein
MNKKLFLVLVIITAILVTGAWVLAAKRSPTGTEGIKPAPEEVKGVETPVMAPSLPKLMHQQQNATPMPKAPAIEKKAALNEANGRPQKALPSHTSLSGTPIRLGTPGGKDLCNLAGSAAWFVSDWIYGLEWYANYQDPVEHGCTAVWPFQVTEIDFQLNFPATWVEAPVYVQGFVFEDIGTPSCPEPEDVPGFISPCSTAVYGYTIPTGGGYFELPMPLTEECCVYEPYFAVVYISTDLSGLDVDMVSENNATATCRSYNDYGGGWVDLVASAGFPGPIMLYSQGYTMPQNDCPTQGDTCGVSSITPSTITVLAGGTANFTANVYFVGTQTSCFLTVTPDPACPSCVTTVTPNPVDTPATSATITIVTDPSTTPGTYTFDVNGAKASATLIVVAPDDSCELARYIAGSGYRFDGWSAGDQNAVLLDPATMCISCGTDLYPWIIKKINSRWVNPSGATALDVIFHIYEAPTPYCNGPGLEIYQFPATITAWSPTIVTVPVPTVLCVDGPFWLAVEYVAVTPPAIVFPSCRMSAQTYDVACSQFNYYQGAWYAWEDFWTPPPPGYLWLGAIGQCEGDECPIECNMQQDNGAPQSYFGNFASGDKVAKYYDPEEYCAPPVYPYRIHDVDLGMYNPWGTPSVDVQIGIYLQCHVPCDGPGTPIYLSPTFTLNPATGVSMQHIDLPEPVCVNEPFFVALEYASGAAGSTPSILFDNRTIPMDTCHGWMFYQPYSPPWIEWFDFWGAPQPGRPMIRVSGFTNHPDCVQEPCDTVQNVLADYGSPTWVWALPSTSGRNYPNQRFNLPATYGGRLDEVRFMFYDYSGDPDPTIYVWATDGDGHPSDNNPPYQALAEFPIQTEAIQPFPTLTVVQTWPSGIYFDPEEEFFVGYSFVFDAGDALPLVSDDYNDPLNTSTRAGFYWPTGSNGTTYCPGGVGPCWLNVFERYSMYMSFVVEAVICPEAPAAPTFTLDVTPSPVYVTPGDPPVHYTADIGQILGYSQPVTLDLADVSPSPAPGIISANFVPNGQVPPYGSDVQVTADASVPYGIYALTIRGTGAKDIVRTKMVYLIAQPPFDEVDVPFAAGSQKATNFGAVGNDAATDNFLWYTLTSQLFDGSFIIGTTDPATICLDVYDCVHNGWTPSEHIIPTYNSTYNANVAYGNFSSDLIPGERDSVFIVGIMEDSVDFSIKIKVYYNTGLDPIMGMYPTFFEDWDVGDAQNNMVAMDTLHNLMYQYDVADPNIVFGMFKAPFYDDPMYNMVAIANPRYIYPNAGFCTGWGLDSLYYLMTTPGYYNTAASDTDMSQLMTAPPFDLPVGGKHIEIWIDFGFAGDFSDPLVQKAWWHRVLRYAGFYRGDVNSSGGLDTLDVGQLDVIDAVTLISYLYRYGNPPKPYADQGDVNADGKVDVVDVVYLLNYLYIGGPPPIDYIRFIPQKWTRPSLFENTNWQ